MDQFSLPEDEITPGGPGSQGESPAPAIDVLPFSAQTYWQYLDGMDMSDAQKSDLLETLWNIMATFADIGFGVDPVQHIIPALVQAVWDEENKSSNRNKQRFNRAAADQHINKEGDQHG
jgi:hypothetical protein